MFLVITVAYLIFWGPLFMVTLVNWDWEFEEVHSKPHYKVLFDVLRPTKKFCDDLSSKSHLYCIERLTVKVELQILLAKIFFNPLISMTTFLAYFVHSKGRA
jgi:hypothetical protein